MKNLEALSQNVCPRTGTQNILKAALVNTTIVQYAQHRLTQSLNFSGQIVVIVCV